MIVVNDLGLRSLKVLSRYRLRGLSTRVLRVIRFTLGEATSAHRLLIRCTYSAEKIRIATHRTGQAACSFNTYFEPSFDPPLHDLLTNFVVRV